MNSSPMPRNGKTSEEIRKNYHLWPRTIGVFNGIPIGIKSNYDRMEVADIDGRILFSFEPKDFLLMEIRFVKPSYILIVGGHYICPNRLRVYNLETQKWQFDYINIECGDMMEPCVGIHRDRSIFALFNCNGVDIIDAAQGKTLVHIESAENAAFCKNGDLLYCDYMGVITLQTKAGGKNIILDLSSENIYGAEISAINCFHFSNTALIAPFGLGMFQYNLDNREIKSIGKLKGEAQHIEVTPDDKYVNISLFDGQSYLLELKTGSEITIEDCMYIETTFWQDGYIVVMGEKGVRTIELSSLI
jgi:hypothetical protein